jgi:hypothetical protein
VVHQPGGPEIGDALDLGEKGIRVLK